MYRVMSFSSAGCRILRAIVQRPGHARGVVGDAEAPVRIEQDHAAVTVHPVFQMANGLGCDPLRQTAGSHAVRRPLGQDKFHDGFAPSGSGGSGCLIVRVAATADQ